MFVIEFDSRSDGGPRLVGPFLSEDDADVYLDNLVAPDLRWSATVASLAAPL